jgi:hypothetical protein
MAETLSPPEITTADVAKGAGTTLLARLGGVLEVVAQPLYIWLFGLAGYGFLRRAMGGDQSDAECRGTWAQPARCSG